METVACYWNINEFIFLLAGGIRIRKLDATSLKQIIYKKATENPRARNIA